MKYEDFQVTLITGEVAIYLTLRGIDTVTDTLQ